MQQPTGGAARRRVVIIGGGFAGLAAARALQHAPVDVVLLDRTNHYLFQPLLYQVAAGVLSPADIAVPTRLLLRNHPHATVLMAEVDAVDLGTRTVSCGPLQLSYDYLVVAAGARHSYFGHPEWEHDAPGLKTLEDARLIRHRFLRAFEEAEKSDDPAEQAALLTFVIIGGGPTGVELAGVLPMIARKGMRRDFRRIDAATLQVVLLEGGPRLLPTFAPELSARACRDLEGLGVRCRTGALVTSVTPNGVRIGDEFIATRTVFWAAGNAASPLVRAMGVPVDRAGRALVAADLSVPDYPEVFVIGDACASAMPAAGQGAATTATATEQQWVPGLAAAANQMGQQTAHNIARAIGGEARQPFRYRNRGSLAVIGRGRAIAEFDSTKVTGRLAWWMWLTVHIAYLAGFRNRVSVLLEWSYAYFTFRPGARLISDAQPIASAVPATAHTTAPAAASSAPSTAPVQTPLPTAARTVSPAA